MAKSIRSKIKRKHRTEFRKTIGTEAYNANMAKTQAKMKEYMDQQQLNSFERLAKTLDTAPAENEATTNSGGTMDVETLSSNATETSSSPTTTDSDGAIKACYRGENKAIPNRKMSRRKKHMLLGKEKKRKSVDAKKERPKPRYFCQF